MDLVSTNEQGNTAVTAMKSDIFKRGTLLLEAIFLIEPASSIALQSARYFPPTIIRIVIDKEGKNYNSVLSHESINESAIPVDEETAINVIRDQVNDLKDMVKYCEQQALSPAKKLLDAAHQRGYELLNKEISRLLALSKVNPNVRQEELDYYEDHWKMLEKVIDSATPRLDALRIIVCV
jgi:ATP-dependent helicase HepA